MKIRKIASLLTISTLFTMLQLSLVSAKTKGTLTHMSDPVTFSLTSKGLRSFEERLTPYLKNRVARRHHRKLPFKKQPPFHESDIMALAKTWSSLSTEFKNLYLEAVQIPKNTNNYSTPGGHFEIFYTDSGSGSVDTTDRYGYLQKNWRNKIAEPNGIPDYIDETGYALDSCWSMTIDRFGFPPPLVYKDRNYTSDKYKIVVEEQEEAYYGVTYLYEQSVDGKKGYSSYISLRHSWDFEEWRAQGYDQKPINGIRVTCAHEFFHTIQYSMSWNVVNAVWLDNFPLSWTEGSASSMEELAFDSINDYHQYAATYFNNPEMSFLSRATSDIVYTNALLLIYLYQHNPGGRRIDFVKNMHFENFNNDSLPFHKNLLQSASLYKSDWQTQLHAFHCASFFTGKRADTARFITDAPFFPTMRILPLKEIDTIVQTLPINSAYYLRLKRDSSHSDTISIDASSSFKAGSTVVVDSLPLYSVLLHGIPSDSTITLTPNKQHKAHLTLPHWSSWDSLTLIATNGNPVEKPTVALFIQPYPVNYTKGTIISDTVRGINSQDLAIITIKAINNLHADYSFSHSNTAPSGSLTSNQTFKPVSGFYSVLPPPFWFGAASITLELHSLLPDIPEDSLYLGLWSERAMVWTPVAALAPDTSDMVSIRGSIENSGVYAILRKSSGSSPAVSKPTFYPNPMSIKRNKGIFFVRGSGITHIAIYRADGQLVYTMSTEDQQSSPDYDSQTFQLHVNRSTSLSPGTYLAFVEHDDQSKNAPRRTSQKLMVTP